MDNNQKAEDLCLMIIMVYEGEAGEGEGEVLRMDPETREFTYKGPKYTGFGNVRDFADACDWAANAMYRGDISGWQVGSEGPKDEARIEAFLSVAAMVNKKYELKYLMGIAESAGESLQ